MLPQLTSRGELASACGGYRGCPPQKRWVACGTPKPEIQYDRSARPAELVQSDRSPQKSGAFLTGPLLWQSPGPWKEGASRCSHGPAGLGCQSPMTKQCISHISKRD